MENETSGITTYVQFTGQNEETVDKVYYKTARNNTSYQVVGDIFDEQLDSNLRVNYSFLELSKAEDFYNRIITFHKKATVKIIKQTWQQLRCYS
ncbi:MAG: hypothetical protein V4604_13705 [Bacteroidota bacterium]